LIKRKQPSNLAIFSGGYKSQINFLPEKYFIKAHIHIFINLFYEFIIPMDINMKIFIKLIFLLAGPDPCNSVILMVSQQSGKQNQIFT
jgi:hypothetical protein